MNDVIEAAVDLQRFCDSQRWRSCIIGGVAVQRWGETRVTRDVDLTLLTGFGCEEAFIDGLLAAYEPRNSNPLEFASRNRVVLVKAKNGVGIDVSLGALPFEESIVNRASVFSFAPAWTFEPVRPKI